MAEEEELRISGAPARGAASDQGLVPKNGFVPPQGAIADEALANISATRPCCANRAVK